MQPHTTVKIANGQSLSEAIDASLNGLVGIKMPAAWTAAAITFQAAETEAGPYYNVHDAAGAEVSVTVAASRYVVLDPTVRRFRWLKLRSGTGAAAVNQAADRTLHVLFSPAGG